MGAGRVIAVDRVPERLHFAREYNGVETLNFDEVDDPVLALREMTGGRGADVCIDAVGMEAEGTPSAGARPGGEAGGGRGHGDRLVHPDRAQGRQRLHRRRLRTARGTSSPSARR